MINTVITCDTHGVAHGIIVLITGLAPGEPSGCEDDGVIFKAVRDGRPYPDHGRTMSQWTAIPPSQVSLAELVTTKRQMDLGRLLDDDSTFYGDLFAHVVAWHGELYLEDGLHRALRCALQSRTVLHARVLRLPD